MLKKDFFDGASEIIRICNDLERLVGTMEMHGSNSNGSMPKMNCKADKGQPCRTPLAILIGGESDPLASKACVPW